MADIADNLKTIRQKIRTASESAGRTADSVTLIAVSKKKSQEDVLAAIHAGQKVFGENRVQEAKGKFQELRRAYTHLELHLIGPLQTNKAEEAVALFDVIETLDRPKLAGALAKAGKKLGRTPVCYIEINIGAEPQKTGIAPADLEAFIGHCRASCGLAIDGLMCIPPRQDDAVRYFAEMKELAGRHKLAQLSMGMSGDYETAIRYGATCVRIGTAIFGAR